VTGQSGQSQPATTEIPSALSGAITFADRPVRFSLTVRQASAVRLRDSPDRHILDLRNIKLATVQSPTYSGSASEGTLTVKVGTHIAKIALFGNYLASTFVTSSKGDGGTAIVDPLLTSSNQQTVLAQSQHV
jgi:hypothetical protein